MIDGENKYMVARNKLIDIEGLGFRAKMVEKSERRTSGSRLRTKEEGTSRFQYKGRTGGGTGEHLGREGAKKR